MMNKNGRLGKVETLRSYSGLPVAWRLHEC